MPKKNQTKQSGIYAPGPVNMFSVVKEPGDENVLMGHPEVCVQYSYNYNVSSPDLNSKAERQDLDYISPARMNMRSKYGSGF